MRPFALDRAFKFQSENTISVSMLYICLCDGPAPRAGRPLVAFIHSSVVKERKKNSVSSVNGTAFRSDEW